MLNNCYSVYKAEILPWKCSAVFRRRSSTVSSASAHSNTSLLPYRWVLWHSAVNAFCERPAQDQSLCKMYWTHWTGSMLISCFTGDCLTVKSKRQKETETDAPTLASCLVRKSMKPKPRWAPPIPFFGRRTVFSSPNVLKKRINTCTLDQISHDRGLFYNIYKGTQSKTMILT